MDKTANKRQFKGGPDAGNKTRFSSDRQPTGKAKSQGKLKSKFGTDLAKAILRMGFIGNKDSDIKKRACEYFGISANDLSIDAMLDFRQIEKAVQKADTHAYKAIKERAYGLPKQKTEVTGKDDEALFQPFNDKQVDKLIESLRKSKNV